MFRMLLRLSPITLIREQRATLYFDMLRYVRCLLLFKQIYSALFLFAMWSEGTKRKGICLCKIIKRFPWSAKEVEPRALKCESLKNPLYLLSLKHKTVFLPYMLTLCFPLKLYKLNKTDIILISLNYNWKL